MTVDRDRVDEVLLDRQLPTYEARQFAATVVDAPAARTYAAVRALDPDQVANSFPPMRALGWLRARRSPAAGRGCVRAGRDPSGRGGGGCVRRPRRGWRGGVRGGDGREVHDPDSARVPPDRAGDFPTFSEPGYGKVALNFRVRPYGRTRSLLSRRPARSPPTRTRGTGSGGTGGSSVPSPI